MSSPITKKSWLEFRDAGLLWWVNRSLHLFGWCIVVELSQTGAIMEAYPARTSWRGFSEKDEEAGFLTLSRHLRNNAAQLCEEIEEP